MLTAIFWLQVLSAPSVLMLVMINPISLPLVTVLNGTLSTAYVAGKRALATPLLSKNSFLLLVGCFGFLLIHSVLVPTKDGGPIYVGKALVLCLCAYFSIVQWSLLEQRQQSMLRHWFFGGLFFAAFYFFLKIYFDHWDQKLFMSLTGIVKRLGAEYGNRPAVVLAVWIWPILLYCRLTLFKKSKVAFSVVTASLLVLVAYAIFQTKSETAQAAIVISGVCFVLASLNLTWTRRFLGSGIILVLLTFPLLTHQIYEKYGHEAEFLPFSSKHRLVIWSYTSELVQAKPFSGRGLRAAHSGELIDLDTDGNAKRIQLTEDRYVPRLIAHHPHNMALQIWLEFGLFGVAFAVALIALFFRFLGTLAASIQRFALSSVAAFTVSCLVGYGLWQTWLLGVAFWALLAFTMLNAHENSRQDE